MPARKGNVPVILVVRRCTYLNLSVGECGSFPWHFILAVRPRLLGLRLTASLNQKHAINSFWPLV